MMDKVVKDGQKGVVLIDYGNMFGVFKFVVEVERCDFKFIIGCEFYVVEDWYKKVFFRVKGERDCCYY